MSLRLWPLLRPKCNDDSCFLFERFSGRNTSMVVFVINGLKKECFRLLMRKTKIVH